MKFRNKIKTFLLKLKRVEYQAAHGGLQSHWDNTLEMRKFALNEIDNINIKIDRLDK